MANAVQPGDLIGERYQVQSVIGAGGMGVVFEATHLQLRQRVAIKVLIPELCEDPEAVVRFLREARAMVKIESEHVARVTDVGTLGSGEPYIVMEYLEGSDLAAVLKRVGRVSIADAVTYLLQASEAIAEAHSVGVIHRDLKPSNLFLARRRDGSSLVKVLDFGISKAVPNVSFGRTSTRTATSVVMGSPLYMSPEQLRSSKCADPRSDVWSLGILLHELLVGEPPFIADTLPGLLAKIIADPPRALRSGRLEAPGALEAVVARCLAKDPAERFQSVSEFAKALQPFAPEALRGRFGRTLFGVHDAKPSSGPSLGVSRSMDTRTAYGVAPVDTAAGKAWAAALAPLRTPSLRGVLAVAGVGLVLTIALWMTERNERSLPEQRVGVQTSVDQASGVPGPSRPNVAAPSDGAPSGAERASGTTASGRVVPTSPAAPGTRPAGADPALVVTPSSRTPLTRARWAAIEAATLTSHTRPGPSAPVKATDPMFDRRK
jgi:tRNA A-37 threonylcarbamoyl transferase component Bud32